MRHDTTMKSRSEFVDDINVAIRDNPLAAGLIGLGAAWFLFGGARSMMLSLDSAASAGRKPAEAAVDAVKAAGTAASDIVSSVTEAAGSGLRSVADTASSNLSHVKDGASEQASRLTDYAGTTSQGLRSNSRELMGHAQDNLRAAFERQPLLIGLAGAAVGIALASAFPRSPIEETWMGEASEKTRGKANELVSQAETVAKRVTDAISSEAQTQGLTADTVRNVVSVSGEKLAAVGAAASSPFKR